VADSILRQIERLDPERDHQRIVFLSTCYDFSFDTTRALEFALFRTFAVSSIAALLDRTGEFQKRPQKRYDDTDIIVSELIEWGYDSQRGAAALARMNLIHGHFAIANDDFLYVLSTFVYEPIRWNARFGWRPMIAHEKLAMFHFWRAVGVRMDISGIPEDYAAFEDFNRRYEREKVAPSAAAGRTGGATRALFASWFPAPLRPLVRHAIHAMMDDATRAAFGFPDAPGWVRRSVLAAMALRARILRLLPRRQSPRLRTAMRRRSYAGPYRLDQVGPPFATE
jgi:ER-bound oxygenase mpaB/B'/Rubber oxygenase, catalytic domain